MEEGQLLQEAEQLGILFSPLGTPLPTSSAHPSSTYFFLQTPQRSPGPLQPPVTTPYSELHGIGGTILLAFKMFGGFPGGSMVKNLLASAGDEGSILGPG